MGLCLIPRPKVTTYSLTCPIVVFFLLFSHVNRGIRDLPWSWIDSSMWRNPWFHCITIVMLRRYMMKFLRLIRGHFIVPFMARRSGPLIINTFLEWVMSFSHLGGRKPDDLIGCCVVREHINWWCKGPIWCIAIDSDWRGVLDMPSKDWNVPG